MKNFELEIVDQIRNEVSKELEKIELKYDTNGEITKETLLKTYKNQIDINAGFELINQITNIYAEEAKKTFEEFKDLVALEAMKELSDSANEKMAKVMQESDE
ncbi:hypothetical protein A0H76_1978 [Hepatospora eriocheir]|uniref:Uncharacterized protein n=1 Tax=Hepatospora eriocheir TaxID=1081669 RepID=A0A1X0QLE6_9MICR|nr:hypothetical protein A0H76_1978 [Hepatospora eriocheir]